MPVSSSTRRHFLESLGRAAGGGAVLRAMAAMGIAVGTSACGGASGSEGAAGSTDGGGTNAPPPPGPMCPTPPPRPGGWPAQIGDGDQVLRLGAGIAGMTAAWEMGKLGYQCTVLEALPSAGGRCRTLRSGDVAEEVDSTQFCEFDDDADLYFNPGPARIPHHHEFVLGYCREFGVPLENFNNDNRAALLHSSSTFAGEPQLARRILSDSRGHIAALLSTAIDQGALDQALSASDREQLLEMLREFGDLNASQRYVGSDRAGYVGQENAGDPQRNEALPPLTLEELLSSEFWRFQLDYSQSLDQQPTMLQPVGGMDKIAKAFETRVGGNILYELVVTGIRNSGAGIEIDFEPASGAAGSMQADYCICTLPATVVRSISNNFSTAHRNAIAGFQYSQSGKLAFQARRFWEQDHNIYGGISWTDQDITQVWYPSASLGSNQGIVLGAYTFGDGAGDRFADMTPQQRIDEGQRQAQALHSEFAGETRNGISVAWPKVPFQLGAWGVSDPGVLRQADAQVYFAGEHISDLQGWQEGAVLSAYHAVNAIVERDSAAL
jgi:monoamine oxidase